MALRRQEQRRNNSIARSSMQDFGRASQSAQLTLPLQPGLNDLRYKAGPRSYMEEDNLVIPFHTQYMLIGQAVTRAVQENPALENHIYFKDGKTLRPYEDVVFDLEMRGLELARRLYIDPSPRNYIVITPPTRGFMADTPEIISCRTQELTGKDGKAVSLQTEIRTDGDFWTAEKKKSGNRHIIQSNRVSLIILSEDMSTLRLRVEARAAMSCEHPAKPATLFVPCP